MLKQKLRVLMSYALATLLRQLFPSGSLHLLITSLLKKREDKFRRKFARPGQNVNDLSYLDDFYYFKKNVRYANDSPASNL
jgi:hypothetical protein